MSFEEKFVDRNIAELSKEYILQYSANINGARITPQIIDGIKTVHRRLLHTMFLDESGKKFQKVVSITADTVKLAHQHGPSSVYSALVNLAQWWNNNIPLITGQGNYGSIDGDPAGADRYIQAKLSDYAYACFFEDWKDSNVDMKLAYNEKHKEPVYLPAKYPNVLINGTLGIGIGLASNIPPYNFKEACEVTIKLIKNPDEKVILIPDLPTGCDIKGGNFEKIFEQGSGVYSVRSTYEIDPVNNTIRITSIPYQISAGDIVSRIADIKVNKGLPELIDMRNATGEKIDITLIIRNDVNPYVFVKKLFETVGGLENTYPVNITVSDDFRTSDKSIREIIVEWIKYRREQVRVMINHKRTSLLAEERTNDVKIFLMTGKNLDKTIEIIRRSKTKADVERGLIEEYKDSEIHMDSLQARALSELRLYQLNIENREECIVRREELKKELEAIDKILSSEDGIDDIIIGELRDGIKRFGTPRKSKLVPWNIEIEEIKESCILQLSSNGMIKKFISTDLSEEPIPIDTNGFALRVKDSSSFIIVDQKGYHSLINVKEIPLDSEVPILRYVKNNLGSIIALLPFDVNSNKCVTLLSQKGILKKFRISDMRISKKPCMTLDDDDKIVRGVITDDSKRSDDILVFTTDGYGQRINSDDIRITSPLAKGIQGVKIIGEDRVEGIYRINRDDEFLVYITSKGRFRLNRSKYLPARNSKHDDLVRLINLVERDKLIAVIGVSMVDELEAFFDDQTSEIIPVSKMTLSTMNSPAIKLTEKSAVTSNITKVKKI